jgi:RNA 2',3'-cyclic 3'-phosphodiesterase
VTSPGTVEAREHLRLFLGLPLPKEARDGVVRWQEDQLAGARGVRVVPASNLHVTLAFLGRRPADDIPGIVDAMRESAGGARRPSLSASRYRETRSVGMVVFADDDERATRLAESLFERLEALGVYERERRPWLPHVTVARFRDRPRLNVAPPDLGLVSPSEVALYHSVLRPTGAQYHIRESVALGG